MKNFLLAFLLFSISLFSFAQNSLDSGLVAFLPFNGNANDESGNNNNGIVNGTQLTQDRFGINNRAYQFDGINSFISIADNPNLFSDELTISLWYKLTETPGGAWVVIGWVDGGHRYQQFFSGGQLCYLNGYNVNQPGILFNPTYGLNDLNIWKNVVVTYKKLSETTSTTSIYVDGELKQTDNHNLAMDYVPGFDFFIGKNHNGNFFKGYLDDLRIYNRVLNNTEILALYNDSTTYFTDSLIAYFPFNGNANDESFLHNNGTVFNAVLTTDRYANQDAAYHFNGNDSYIQVPDNSMYDFGNGDFSISSWINVSEIRTARIVSAGYVQNDNIWGLGFGIHPVWGTGNRINYFVYSGNAYQDFSSDEILNYTPGEWIFVTAAKSGNQIKFYTNGLPVGTSTISYPSNSNSYLSIGCRQESNNNLIEFFKGKIDEVKIFNKSFSDQEIWEMYKATTTAPNLLLPLNNSIINTLTPLLDWDSLVTATDYTIYIATDSSFNNIILSQIANQSSYLVENGVLSADVEYFWKVRTNNDGGIGPWSESNRFSIILTDVEIEEQLPKEFSLLQNYPNPFNPSTTISWQSPVSSWQTLKVFDVLGKEIETLIEGYYEAGTHSTLFIVNSSLPSGVYFYQLKAGDYTETKMMILLR